MPLACSATWAHCWLMFSRLSTNTPRSFFTGQLSSFPKPVALPEIVVTHVQDPTFGLVESHSVGLSPLIQPVQIPLQSLHSLKQINTPTQLGITCRLTEGALHPLIQITDIDVKQDCTQN